MTARVPRSLPPWPGCPVWEDFCSRACSSCSSAPSGSCCRHSCAERAGRAPSALSSPRRSHAVPSKPGLWYRTSATAHEYVLQKGNHVLRAGAGRAVTSQVLPPGAHGRPTAHRLRDRRLPATGTALLTRPSRAAPATESRQISGNRPAYPGFADSRRPPAVGRPGRPPPAVGRSSGESQRRLSSRAGGRGTAIVVPRC